MIPHGKITLPSFCVFRHLNLNMYLIAVGHVDGRHALGVPRRDSVADLLRKERWQRTPKSSSLKDVPASARLTLMNRTLGRLGYRSADGECDLQVMMPNL